MSNLDCTFFYVSYFLGKIKGYCYFDGVYYISYSYSSFSNSSICLHFDSQDECIRNCLFYVNKYYFFYLDYKKKES